MFDPGMQLGISLTNMMDVIVAEQLSPERACRVQPHLSTIWDSPEITSIKQLFSVDTESSHFHNAQYMSAVD